MQKESFLINVKDVKSVRVTCKTCGTAVILPLGRNNFLSQCVSCSTKLPFSTISELMNQLEFLTRQLRDEKADISFQLHIEGESS